MVSNLGSAVVGHHPLIAALKAGVTLEQRPPDGPEAPAVPFITISRQSGSGGRTLGRQLVERLNAADPLGPRWTLWDHELVEKVSAESGIDEPFIEALEDSGSPWIRDLVAELSLGAHGCPPDEFKIYRRLAMTVHALARVGRAVIVGRGSVFVTGGMPGGVHVRLVAPLHHRVRQIAQRLGVTPEHAAAHVHRIDRHRESFYRRYWPTKSLAPENFTLTLNTAAIGSEEKMAQSVLALLPAAVPSRPLH
jgi:Cytidylate kinase-like family